MPFDADLIVLISEATGFDTFWFKTPEGYDVLQPCVIISQVGGKAGWYVDNSRPSHQHARIQIDVWARDQADARDGSNLVEKALSESDFICEPYGSIVDRDNIALGISGTRQDFGFWHPRTA